MKLQFKYQKFQADAAKAVADVFDGQPYLAPSYMTGEISGKNSSSEERKGTFSGWSNQKIVPELSDERILDNLRKIQKANQIPVSSKLEGRENGYHLTVEMETGVGKTYTYIKTIYELNKRYGWSKFLVVVPSIAIREGVYKTFQITREHFAKEYGKKIRFFIYNSERLTEIDRFASDNSVHVMIINSQAFNAKGKDARRIYMNLDEFQGRKPIDLIAGTNPIIIIDEPQSVEGRQTKERMKQFCPLITLRYSATHKADSLYNMVYRLSAADAYRKYLVKKIEVKGIAETKTMASDGYIYVERICCSESDAAAVIQYDFKMGSGIRKQYRKVGIGDDLYEISGGLEEYQGGFEVKQINRQEESVEFVNGMKLYAGDINGKVDEEQIRRIQIRETILSHIDRERRLFGRRIKVLSLFFIDEVARYKKYDETGCPQNGSYADIFEEEYRNIIENMKYGPGDEKYRDYIEMIPVEKTHAGYFSIDRKGHVVDSKGKGKEMMSDDQDAYDLIMKNKELLLECDPKQSPVRFIFSHSALREGWDNPNVFQICTLKNGGSEVRKRQEVGRGLRLCVNGDGQRMDRSFLGQDVHRVNTLTVIASESYESFVKGLQSEIAEDVFGKQSRKADVCRDIEVIIPENARSRRVELKVDQEKLNGEEFSALWSNICLKSTYTVNFDTEKLVEDAVKILNRELHIQDVRFKGKNEAAKSVVKYDLAGKLADMTGLKRKTVIEILSRVESSVFQQFQESPEEFIAQAERLILNVKETAISENIIYHTSDEKYTKDIFTQQTIQGKQGVDAMKVGKHLYDYVKYRSGAEKEFIERLEASKEVAVYVKLPEQFYISTPAGRYMPEWAIALYRETKGKRFFVVGKKAGKDKDSNQSKIAENIKICCASKHLTEIRQERSFLKRRRNTRILWIYRISSKIVNIQEIVSNNLIILYLYISKAIFRFVKETLLRCKGVLIDF